jgi:hypothetical protein
MLNMVDLLVSHEMLIFQQNSYLLIFTPTPFRLFLACPKIDTHVQNTRSQATVDGFNRAWMMTRKICAGPSRILSMNSISMSLFTCPKCVMVLLVS